MCRSAIDLNKNLFCLDAMSVATEPPNSTSSTRADHAGELDLYPHIIPVNLILAIVIILQNILVIYDYFPERKKLVTAMFILIAVSDMFVAIGEIPRAGLALFCIHNEFISMPLWLATVLQDIGPLSWTMSIFFNAVLTVTRTVVIARPFAGINKKIVIGVIISGSVFWFLVAVADNVIFYISKFSRLSSTDFCKSDGLAS